MENLLKKIDPQKLLGRKINFSASDYFDKKCKNPQYTIVAAFFDKSDDYNKRDNGPVLKVAMVDLYDAAKNEEHEEKLDELLKLKAQDEIYKYCKNAFRLKTAWLEIYNPLMLNIGDDYMIEYRSEYDNDFYLHYNEDDRDDIFTFEGYLRTLTDMQTQFIEIFASKEFLGKEYFKQVKRKIKQHFTSKISEHKEQIRGYEEEVNQMEEAVKDVEEVENI